MALMESQLMLASSGVNENMHAAYKSMEIVFDGFEHMYSVSSKSIDVDLFRSASRESVYLGTQIEDTGNKAEEAANQTASAADIIKDRFSQALSAVKSSLSMGEILELADSMSQTRTRLAAVTGDLDSAAVLQDKILDSATRAGVPYQEMADAVANMGIQAKNAFGSNDEIVAFTELINKQFAISGTSAEGMSMSMDKLTQTMASGVLSGEDFNSIMAQAPAIVQTIADYMGMPVDKIQELASGGQLTADIIRNAMFSSADEINTRFSEIPYTFGQVANMVKNVLLKAFDPRLQIIGSAANWIYDNFNIVKPIILGVAAAVMVLRAAQIALNTVNMIASGIIAAKTLAHNIHLAALALQTGATFEATAAQWSFNTALYACPITWIVIAIIAAVAALYLGIAALNEFAGTSISATGIVMGTFSVLCAFIINQIIMLYNVIAAFVNFIGNVFNDPIASIAMLFTDLFLGIAEGFANLAHGIEDFLNKTFGLEINLSSGIDEIIEEAKSAQDKIIEESKGWKTYIEPLEYLDYNESWNKGYSMGATFANSVKDIINMFDYDELLDSISENTGSTAASLNNASEDLEYLRDIAEQEAINKFTTSEVKIDMSGMTNRIDSDMDIDGIITKLTDGFAEALEVAAEGVHI